MRRLVLLAALVFAAPLAAAEKPFFFQKGDRVVFLGDSITEQYQYSTDIEAYLTLRFPHWKIFFLNAGISGDTANGGAGRFKKHVLAEKPTAVTIDFGMNDGRYGEFKQDINDVYKKRTEEMLQMAKDAGVRVALISPNCVDPRFIKDEAKKKNMTVYVETQKQFYAPLKEFAAKFDVPFVDQYAVTREVLAKIAKDDSKASPFPDAVHTNGQGGLLMAHTILVGLNAPALVSDATIEGTACKKSQSCKIENIANEGDTLTFTRTDEAFPIPVQKDWLPILPYVNDLKDLNWYGLTVKGLKAGEYAVSIEGKEVGKFSADQLAAGVNLGNAQTGPVYDFTQSVFKAINEKNAVMKKRFRGTILSKMPEQEVIDKLLAEIKTKQDEIYKMLEPKTWKYGVKLTK